MNLIQSILLKIILLLGTMLLSAYLFFRIQLINTSPYFVIFATLLFLAELHTIAHLYGMFYSLWPRKYQKFNKFNADRNLKINMFICVCGEPVEIIRNTILAAKKAALAYNNFIGPATSAKVIVLNDGFVAKKENWQEVQSLCKDLGVFHIARSIPGGFKSGNINNGLKNFSTSDPENTIDAFFDSDFAAKEEFLLEITKPFTDPKIDFAQSPQRYTNEQTWVAKAAAAHQIFFFDYICPSKGHDNALFLCGTNFAIRRSALISAGGFDTRFITEDYATSLNLHLIGKRGVFIPKVLALGAAPISLKQYFIQQQRWSKGNFDVTRTYLKQLLFGPLTIKQKMHYLLSATYYLIGIRDLILIFAPVPYLFFGISLIKTNTLIFLAFVYVPLLMYNFILYTILFTHPIKSIVLDIVSFPVYVSSFISSLFKKNLGFIVTIKKYEKDNPFRIYALQLFTISVLTAGIIFSSIYKINSGTGAYINYFWSVFNVTFLTAGFLLIIKENYNLTLLQFLPLPKILLRQTIALVTVFTILIFGTYSFDPKAFAGEKRLLVSQELLVPDNGVYYGYYFPELNSHPTEVSVGLIENEKPSLVMFYEDWGKNEKFNTRFFESLSQKNIVPIVTWEPWNSQENYSLKSITTGEYDVYIRRWAQGAALYKKPLFLRFAHEMNGDWYPWGNIEGNTPEDYINMWRHVHDIFTEEQASNVIWVWSPNNTDEKGNSDNILDYFPGHEYTDWVGFSGFNWGTINSLTRWYTFKFLATESYSKLSNLNKPIMVSETSSVSLGGNKANWFKQTLLQDIPSFPNIKAVVFFNQDFKNADLKISTDPKTLEVLEKGLVENSYYLKNPSFLFIQ